MADLLPQQPQCKFFVVRKKRLCRMTVKPGRQYCGEHEPEPKKPDGLDDTRIPCPNDPKHTCYVRKLEKHLLICNARPVEQPPYIVYNINSPGETDVCDRKPLTQLPKEIIMAVIEKVNTLYDKHVKDQIATEPELPIHRVVLGEFSESDRSESSLRHLRQVSSLLWLVEREGLVSDHTCYVELGAGKGHMSYYARCAWASSPGRDSCSLLLDRAALRHKRDNKLAAGGGGGAVLRLRADLAHVCLARAPLVEGRQVVALAKHLCGVATDYSLRCVAGAGAGAGGCGSRGVVLATCCHHRCARAAYVANKHLQELGITGEEFNVMLGIVSWATCGDGRSRLLRNRQESGRPEPSPEPDRLVLPQVYREQVGRRAKQLLDWGRVLYLRECGFEARLCYFVSVTVSPENVCIVAKRSTR